MAVERIKVTSASFKDGQMMPERYAYDKENLSPPIEWSDLPSGTKSVALICDDPDAPSGTWVHWVIFNIPPADGGLPEGVPQTEILDNGAIQGINDFKKIGYDGPYPPYGVHRYVFAVYAIDTTLDLEAGSTKQDLLSAINGHILGSGKLTGRYKRKIDIPIERVID
ncbi:MAG: YbhB/YbcL family Raf kinase inhibitor-like protein [Candidatus Omnitrophica bacterium]|nr:YbhB/YbcL family Raf kinase inhibitor-like protein [Candidatus Omnitrophota bacterium]